MSADGTVGPSGDGQRIVEDAFLLALNLGLRARGVPAGPFDLLSSEAIVRCQESWRRDDLRRALRAALVRRPSDGPRFDALFDDLYAPGAAKEGAQGLSGTPPFFSTSPSATDARLSENAPTQLGAGAIPRAVPGVFAAFSTFVEFVDHLRKQAVVALRRGAAQVYARARASGLARGLAKALIGYPIKRVAGAAGVGLAIIAVASWGGRAYYRGVAAGAGRAAQTDPQIASILLAVSLASAIALLAVLIWRGAAARKPAEAETASESAPPSLASPDSSVFRVGWVGGAAAPFMGPVLAAEIADMFAYRSGECDPDELDIPRTIEASVRLADGAALVYASRRELPTILLAVDVVADAAVWHSLAEEFEQGLLKRGVNFRRIDYDGSFFAGRRGIERGRRAAAEIEDEIGAPGWTVTAIFGEARRLTNADFDLLRYAAENGPVLFLELSDPALWGWWQRRLRLAKIDVAPATALGLRDALARVFAPDHAPIETAAPPLALAQLRAGAATVEQFLTQTLGPALADWAAACALLQPVSFALAERLRKSVKALDAPHHALAYSRIAALPGSWVGPEGLKFEPSVRNELLRRFAGQPAAQRDVAIGVVRAAFLELDAEGRTRGVTAESLARYALARAAVFGSDLNEEVTALVELDQEGIVDRRLIRSFVANLVPPDAPGELTKAPGAISLSQPITRAAGQRYFDSVRGRADTGANRLVAARWSLGVPDIRIRPRGARDDDRMGAAFFSGGRHLLIDRGPGASSERLQVADLVLGTDVTLSSPLQSEPETGLWSARDGKVAVLAVRGKAPLLIRAPGAGGDADFAEKVVAEPLRAPQEDASLGGDEISVAGLDSAGRYIAFTPPAQRAIRVLDVTSGEYSPLISCEGEVAAIQVETSGRVTVALRDGRLVVAREGSDEKVSPGQTIARTGTEIYALASISPTDPDGPLVVASEDVVRLLVPDTKSGEMSVLAEYRVSGRLSHVAVLPERPAALVRGRNAGLSVAVLGRDGGFDIVGLPKPEAGPLEPNSPISYGLSDDANFTPLALLERAIRPNDPARRVLALHPPSRRVAIQTNSRIEIRPLIYKSPEPESEPQGQSGEAGAVA